MTTLTLDRAPRRGVPTSALLPFVALTFAITWGLIGFYVLAPERAVAWFGEISGTHPVFVLATWAPGIAAFTLVLAYAGPSGLAAFLGRLALWRAPLPWVLFVVLGVPLTFAAGALVKGTFGLVIPEGGVVALLGAMAFMLVLGPVEEFGWRGVAQPLLQRLVAPVWAGVLIGAVWGFWHVPAFLLSGTVQSGWAFGPFFVGNIALAVIVTPLLNASRGSLLWPVLFHWQLINPLWPDAQPYDTVFFVLVALVIVWLNRHTMFTRVGAVTEVVPNAETRS